MMNAELRRLARRYRDGEEMQMLGQTVQIRYKGLDAKLGALRDAKLEGFSVSELLEEVAQIDVEEDDVR